MTTVERFNGTYEALSPVSHGSDEDFGMEQRLRTIEMAVRDDGEVYHEDVPVVSGNSLRGQLRDLLAEDFLNLISDEDPVEIHDTLSNAFYSGGTLERGNSPGMFKRRMIHNIRDRIPPLSLLGCAVGSEMIESRLNMGMIVPISSETESYTGVESEQSVYEFVDTTFYTRMDDDAGRNLDNLAADGGEERDSQQMRYTVQVLQPGTQFSHWMALEGADGVERACLGRAFELFGASPHIGGMQSIGHGHVTYEYDGGLPDSQPYLDFIKDNREEIREFVLGLDDDLEG